ncbi:hypothetical protein FRX31_030841 [Thalictrum thalictroides]|uniref:MORF/ORRM1/DAG-like MORF domain-containing protein n=1 Tax=Thalictrum thalictroides TaxID=46969 RepID=A0A7J6V3C9_THATH|nr:hypothetical protein FRX31_030841 [Thalictrum thalictroides]
MANLRTLVSKPTRRLLSSLNTANLFSTWPLSPGRSLTRPGLLVSSSIAPAPTLKSFDRHSYSIEDDSKPHLPIVGPYCPLDEYDPVEEPIRKFSPLNWNGRLENMFDYYNSNSDCNNNANATGAEDSGHWLIFISKPDCRAVSDHSIKLLAEFLGSEAKAIDKMYVIWCNGPYGFGAEIDQEIAMKLQEHPNVLQVLQDNSFDIKNKEFGILTISHSRYNTELVMDYLDYSPADEDDRIRKKSLQTCEMLEPISAGTMAGAETCNDTPLKFANCYELSHRPVS